MFNDEVDDDVTCYEHPALALPPHLQGVDGLYVGDEDDASPVWRCPRPADGADALSIEALESPVYRSVPCLAPLPDHDAIYGAGGACAHGAAHRGRWLPLTDTFELQGASDKGASELVTAKFSFEPADSAPLACAEAYTSASHAAAAATVTPFAFNLPSDLFDHVLAHLDPHPDLFASMGVCHAWYQAAVANYQRRWRQVAAIAGELSRMVGAASPGDTILLEGGVHAVHSTITIDVPLRLMATRPSDSVAIVAQSCVAIRSRTNVSCDGLEVRRVCAIGAHPNSVVHAEAGTLEMSNCVVVGAEAEPLPEGGRRAKPPCSMAELASATASTLCLSPQQFWAGSAGAPPPPCRSGLSAHEPPQTGVSVGPAARAELTGCHITHHRGPALKVCRGQLIARESVISHSACGANVVVNGGRISLLDNEVHSARGDGIASWNNPGLTIERNRIHSNAGSGIALNSGSADTTITANHIFGNAAAAVRCSASRAEAALVGNTIEEVEGAMHVSDEPSARTCAAIAQPPYPVRLQRSVTMPADELPAEALGDCEPPPVGLRPSRSAVDRLEGGGGAFDSD